MNTSIRSTRQVPLTPELENYINGRVALGTGRFEARLREVRVYIADLNGPRGGADKLCQLTAAFRNGRVLTVRRIEPVVAAAVATAVTVLNHRIARELKRHQRASAASRVRRAAVC